MSRSKETHRSLDFWIGVPLVVLLASIRKRRRLPATPHRIGVISPTAIGDLILETGILAHIHETYPAAEIHLFHGKTNAGLIPLLPIEVKSHECNFTNFRTALMLLKETHVDVLVDLTPWPRLTALCSALSGAVTIGFQSERQFRHYAFDITAPHMSTRHEAENLRALSATFAPCSQYRPHLRKNIPPIPLQLPYERLILCHVSPGGSQAEAKSWPKSHWIELTNRLADEDFLIGFTGTQTDSERIQALLSETRLPRDKAFSLCGKLSLVGLAGALQRARLLITVDTGVLHLASVLNTPVIGLHGPTCSERWGARSPAAISLNAPHPEAGFIHFGFEKSPRALEIMATLAVDVVFETAKKALSASQR